MAYFEPLIYIEPLTPVRHNEVLLYFDHDALMHECFYMYWTLLYINVKLLYLGSYIQPH